MGSGESPRLTFAARRCYLARHLELGVRRRAVLSAPESRERFPCTWLRPVTDPLGGSLAGGVVAGRLFDGELCRDDCPKVQGGQKGHHLVIAGRQVLELGIIAKRWKQCFLPWFERW